VNDITTRTRDSVVLMYLMLFRCVMSTLSGLVKPVICSNYHF